MRKVVLPFLLSFFLLLVVIVVNIFAFRDMQAYNQSTDESKQTIQLFDRISLQLKSALLYTPLFESAFATLYASYKQDADSLPYSLQKLSTLVSDDSTQKQILDSVKLLVNLNLPVLMKKNIHEIITAGDAGRVQQIERIDVLLREGLQREEEQLQNRKKHLESSAQLNNLLSWLFGALALCIVVFSFYKYSFASKKSQWLEGFLESILDTSQKAIIYYKAVRQKGEVVDFKIEYMNKAATPLLHLNPVEVVGQTLSAINVDVSKPDLWQMYLQVMKTGKTLETEYLFQHHGSKHWFLVSIAKLGDGLRLSFQDITQLKEYELELKKNIAALQRSNSELEEYAYVTSHDLQEPLRKIRTFGGMLQESQQNKLDAKGQQQLQKMLDATERMSMLIKDLLTFSSLEKSPLFVEVNLSEILSNVLNDLEVPVEQKHATVTADALPVINAIPVQMNQLFYNLLNNSLKFSKQNVPPKIHISCRRLNEEESKEHFPSASKNPYFELVFSDNGIGFDNEFTGQIFGMFKRLHDKGRYAGSGIGLALCKKVVENHHGKIFAKGKEADGACFYVYLPANPLAYDAVV